MRLIVLQDPAMVSGSIEAFRYEHGPGAVVRMYGIHINAVDAVCCDRRHIYGIYPPYSVTPVIPRLYPDFSRDCLAIPGREHEIGRGIKQVQTHGLFAGRGLAIAAGNDMLLSSLQKEITIDQTAEGRQLMRQACHNILYVVANSNALELVRTGVPSWIYKLELIDAALLGLIALGFMGCTKKKKPVLKISEGK